MAKVPEQRQQRVAGAVRLIAFVVLTGVLAVVIITALLVFGVEPRLVFTPGFLVRSWGESLGLRVPKPVGVLSTVVVYWAAIVAVRFAVAQVVARGSRG